MSFHPSNVLDAANFSAIGEFPVQLLLSDALVTDLTQSIKIGLDPEGHLTCDNAEAFDILLTSHVNAPAPWVSVAYDGFDAHAQSLANKIGRTPVAASILAQLLRMGSGLTFEDALQVESLAYSTLLTGKEFALWRRGRAPARVRIDRVDDLVHYDRDGDLVTLTLNDPSSGNAMSAAMRDALYTALANVVDDPTQPKVMIQAQGRCFSTGGDLAEFGSAHDLAAAHIVRSVHSCARLIYQLGDRASVRFHGAAIGSGLEVPAAAARRETTPSAWFQLPELTMGLIPGAGGTVTVARAIGRHRTLWMALSGKRLTAQQALKFGLISAIVAP